MVKKKSSHIVTEAPLFDDTDGEETIAAEQPAGGSGTPSAWVLVKFTGYRAVINGQFIVRNEKRRVPRWALNKAARSHPGEFVEVEDVESETPASHDDPTE